MATTETTAPIPTTVPGRRRHARRLLTHGILPRIVLVVGLIAFMAPFYWMFISAVKTPQEGARFPPTLIPETWVWQNFPDAINFIPFGVFAVNSLILTVGITIGAVLSNTLVAYGFSGSSGPGVTRSSTSPSRRSSCPIPSSSSPCSTSSAGCPRSGSRARTPG